MLTDTQRLTLVTKLSTIKPDIFESIDDRFIPHPYYRINLDRGATVSIDKENGRILSYSNRNYIFANWHGKKKPQELMLYHVDNVLRDIYRDYKNKVKNL